MNGQIIALIGPSGVGKKFAKQAIKKQSPDLKELTVLTTRPSRPSDGVDRQADISTNDFLDQVKNGEIIGAHQPFGEQGDWYGFSKKQIDNLLSEGKIILTEIHIDNVELFKKKYGDSVHLLAMLADREYLEHNLKLRNSEKEEDRMIRLDSAEQEIEKIKKFQVASLIDRSINVNWENRDQLAEIMSSEVKSFAEKPTENKLKFK